MKFSLSPLVLFAVLFTSAFALPTETALSVDDHLSKRSSASDSGSIPVIIPSKRQDADLTLSGQVIGVKRDTAIPIKRQNIDLTLSGQVTGLKRDTAIPIKRQGADLSLNGQIGGLKRDTEELSKRSEEYIRY